VPFALFLAPIAFLNVGKGRTVPQSPEQPVRIMHPRHETGVQASAVRQNPSWEMSGNDPGARIQAAWLTRV